MKRRQLSFGGRQRGVALIMAVLIVALATILAVNVAFKGVLDQRRSATLFSLDQAFEIALGAEALAAEGLRLDAQQSQTDHLGEAWAKPVVLPIDEGLGVVEGRLEDLAGPVATFVMRFQPILQTEPQHLIKLQQQVLFTGGR